MTVELKYCENTIGFISQLESRDDPDVRVVNTSIPYRQHYINTLRAS